MVCGWFPLFGRCPLFGWVRRFGWVRCFGWVRRAALRRTDGLPGAGGRPARCPTPVTASLTASVTGPTRTVFRISAIPRTGPPGSPAHTAPS
ncbi:hypothetical protein GZL_06061 [Streptomyces sp. 769]|nr:hypothetical protein GZL_06061 [Streptomyces sp. 769]